MRTQLWTPDTCQCKVEETCDENGDAISATVVRKCPAHIDVPDAELYGVLYSNDDGENKVKNQIEGYLLGRAGPEFGFHEAKRNKDGSDAGIGWKDGLKYQWHFSGTGKDRKINVSVKGGIMNDAQKKKMKEDCAKRFKSDRIIL